MTFNAGVALVYGDNVVLAKRVEFWKGKKVSFGGYWAPFAGAIEKDESPMATALRELKEEAGIEKSMHELKYVASFKEPSNSFNFYIIEIDELPHIELNEEHTEYGIFKIDALDTLTERIDPKIIKGLKNYIERRDGGIRFSEK